MSDARTLRLAHLPVTERILEAYTRFIRLEHAGTPHAEALKQAGLTADDVARTTSAVSAFCRPRLLRRRLARATATTPEREQKRLEALAAPIDDADFIALYGGSSWQVLQKHEAALVELRTRSAGEG